MNHTSIPSFRDRILTARSTGELEAIKAEMNAPGVKMRARTFRRNNAALYTRTLELRREEKDRR